MMLEVEFASMLEESPLFENWIEHLRYLFAYSCWLFFAAFHFKTKLVNVFRCAMTTISKSSLYILMHICIQGFNYCLDWRASHHLECWNGMGWEMDWDNRGHASC